jgi:hypothetical protein
MPAWVTRPRETVEEAGISTEEVSDAEVQELAEKVATDPEFERKLREAVSSLDGDGRTAEQEPAARPQTDRTPSSDTSRTEDGANGDSNIEWVGTGNRELTNPPAVPDGFFSARDFGGRVPAQASFVVVFEVNRLGQVQPGSVIFQQGGEYLVAQEKLRSRIRNWRFEPAQTDSLVTGIFTLTVRREDIR